MGNLLSLTHRTAKPTGLSATSASVEPYRAVRVPREHASHIARHYRGWVSAALEIGDWTEAEIYAALDRDEMVLWCAGRNGQVAAIAASEIVQIDRHGLVCTVVLCGGNDLNEWRPLLYEIEGYARRQGCQRMRLSGRRGWLKIYPDFKEQYVTADKELT